MKKKIEKLMQNFLYSVIGVVLLNVYSILTYLGVSGLLYKIGYPVLTLSYIYTSVFIIGISTFIFSILYIILIHLKKDNISSNITVLCAIVFAYLMSSAYQIYFSEFASNMINGIDFSSDLVIMGVYVFAGLINIFILTYASIYGLIMKVFGKKHK